MAPPGKIGSRPDDVQTRGEKEQRVAALPRLLRTPAQAVLRGGFRLRRTLRLLNGGAPERVCFILTVGRTGSNLLRSYLNSCEGVRLGPEVLNPGMREGVRWQRISKHAVLRHLERSVRDSGPVVGGCKLMMYQLRHHGIGFDDLRARFPKARFLLLYRASLIDQFISLLRAQKAATWSQKRESSEVDRFPLDLGEFRTYARNIHQRYREMMAAPWVCDRSLLVEYESLAADPEGVFRSAIGPFLSIETAVVTTDLVKQNRQAREDLISNHDEIAADLEAAAREWEIGAERARVLFSAARGRRMTAD